MEIDVGIVGRDFDDRQRMEVPATTSVELAPVVACFVRDSPVQVGLHVFNSAWRLTADTHKGVRCNVVSIVRTDEHGGETDQRLPMLEPRSLSCETGL